MMHSNSGEQPSWQIRLLSWTVPLGFGLGAVGTWLQERAVHGQGHVVDSLYYALQLFALKAPSFDPPLNLALEAGRWLAATSTLLAAYTSIRPLLGPRLLAAQVRRCKNHTIVCGTGQEALDVVRYFSLKQKVVLVIPEANQAMEQSAQNCHAFVLVGRPTDLLEQAGVSRAARLVATCADDGANVEIVAKARGLTASRVENPVLCFAQVKDDDLRRTVEQHNFIRRGSSCLVKTFDAFDDAARDILMSRSDGLPLDQDGVEATDRRKVRLIILGFASMGQTVALKAAQIGHFANGERVQMCVVDKDAKARLEEFEFRYPAFKNSGQIEVLECPIQSLKCGQLLERSCDDPDSLVSVAVCVENDAVALSVAVRLRKQLEARKVRVALRMSRSDGLTALLKDGPLSELPIKAFGWIDVGSLVRPLEHDVRESLAKAVHREFRDYAEKSGLDARFAGGIRDWSDMDSDDFRESSRQQVDHIAIKLRAIRCEECSMDDPRSAARFTEEEVELLAQMEHRRWFAERTIADWTIADKTDLSKRTSPDLCGWDELTKPVKEYDRHAVRSIPRLLQEVRGTKICRSQKQVAPER